MKMSGVKSAPPALTDKKELQIVPNQQIFPQVSQNQDYPREIKKEELGQAVDKLNKAMEIFSNNEVRFSIHEKTKHIMVQVIKQETKEVIAEYPPKKILDLVAQLQEMVGIIVDKRV